MSERPHFDVIKGPERDGNVIPFMGRQKKMFIVPGEDGLTHLVPEERVQPELPELGKLLDMKPGVNYELMGRTGLEERIFEVDSENPFGTEGRGIPRDPDFDPDAA